MIYMSRKLTFSAMHAIRVPSWSDEENRCLSGICSNPHGHGHDFTLEVMVSGNVDKATGMIVNIRDIDDVVKTIINDELDGKFLNQEHPFFRAHVPTTENMVRYLWNILESKLTGCQLHKIKLWESPYLLSEKEKGSMVKLTRKYHFSTAHRLNSEMLSEEENLRIFGKCNNPYGHGHNYYLDVTVAGEPDPVTGMVVNIGDLDEIVERLVLQKFDHKHLNLDTEEFKHLNPTSENLAIVIWNLLVPHLPNLHKIGLWETEKNYFEYLG
jgi:6-pyruvoyltetrahydropterin/6-carboxytetrahydropterin synthase